MKTKKENESKSSFLQLNKTKAILYALLIFALSAFALNSNFPSKGYAVLIFNALINTTLILLLYVIACIIALFLQKVRGK